MKAHVTGRPAWLAALGVLVAVPTTVQGSADEPIPAVWRERALSFSYGSAIAIYSCSALETRVGNLLRAVGARDDIKVRATHCSESLMPSDINLEDPPGGWQGTRPLSERYYQRQPSTTHRCAV